MEDLLPDIKNIRLNLIILWEVTLNFDFYQLRLACPKSGYKTRDSVEAYFNEPVPHAAELVKVKKSNIVEEDIEITKKEVEMPKDNIQ